MKKDYIIHALSHYWDLSIEETDFLRSLCDKYSVKYNRIRNPVFTRYPKSTFITYEIKTEGTEEWTTKEIEIIQLN